MAENKKPLSGTLVMGSNASPVQHWPQQPHGAPLRPQPINSVGAPAASAPAQQYQPAPAAPGQHAWSATPAQQYQPAPAAQAWPEQHQHQPQHYAPQPAATSPAAERVAAPAHAPPAVRRSAVPGCLHAYPLSVRKTGLFSALRLALKTTPYALFRLFHWSLFSALSALLLFAVVGASVASMMYLHQYAGAGVLLAGILAWALLWIPFVNRKTFGTLCGHIAILTELITKGQLGNGNQGMFAFAKETVATRLGELSSIQLVYDTIRRSLYQLARVLNFADGLLPIGLGPVHRLIHRVVGWVSPYITVVVLSYGIARNDDDLGVTGMDGLCYSAQNATPLLKTAVGALILQTLIVGPLWIVTLAAFVSAAFYLVFPIAGGDLAALQTVLVSGGLPALVEASNANPIPLLIAVLVSLAIGVAFAYPFVKTVRESLVKPTLITMVMLKFHVAIENQPLDPSWRERVSGAGTALDALDSARRKAGLLGV